MARRSRSSGPTPVESTRHADTRANIPTAELADVRRRRGEEARNAALPARRSLDPQLVWKGKDEQDRRGPRGHRGPDLHPGEDRPARPDREPPRHGRGPPTEPELDAVRDFDGLEFDELVDFYRHEGNWSNRLILGDSLLVMTSLAEKENLSGKVQMIYIDPPYGIKFGSNWQVSTRKRDVKDGKDEDATRQPEQIRAFRDTWELGIHSYLGVPAGSAGRRA